MTHPNLQSQPDDLRLDNQDRTSNISTEQTSPIYSSSKLLDRRAVNASSLHIETDLELAKQTRPITPSQRSVKSILSMSSYFSNLHGSQSFDFPLSASSTSSALPSPALSALIDLTPLPSPLYAGGTPRRSNSRNASFASGLGLGVRPIVVQDGVARSNSLNVGGGTPRRKKTYGSLLPTAVEGDHDTEMISVPQRSASTSHKHARNRSVSDFTPDPLFNPRQRVSTMGSLTIDSDDPSYADIRLNNYLQREKYLASQRGLTNKQNKRWDGLLNPTNMLPSPPTSNESVTESDVDDQESMRQVGVEYFQATIGSGERNRRWRSIKIIGKGTFSKVFLATSEHIPIGSIVDEKRLDPRGLVAVKVCEHGPAGGADEDRIKHSLEREISILKSVSHASLVQLKAIEETCDKTFLIMTYCTGGDLFSLASERRDVMTSNFVQRIFAELFDATCYLHANLIVHRDIKLENVLVNYPPSTLTPACLPNPQSCPYPLITLTDLGLSRRIPSAPASALLTTRCGSEDYAAPEILLGQPYDGRSTDLWALGVLLYALMEGRLPFDAPPGKPDRSKNTHRIARCDWIWSRFGDEYGDWDEIKGKGWEGARSAVGGTLRKVKMGRWNEKEIKDLDWVKGGITVEGGLRRAEVGDDCCYVKC